MKNNLTVIIPCKDDLRILNCIKSIDYPVDICIVFNGATSDFINKVKKETKNNVYPVMVHTLEKPNLSWALEYGTQKSRTDCVLYMDSDCTFKKGAIKAFVDAIKRGNPNNEVYKGDVVFEVGDTFISKIIAKSRTHHTAEVLTAYKPPLAISKKIVHKIGGYFFDMRLIWREDSDFDNRIRVAGIKIFHVPKGIIFHESITLKTDLRSTYRYGIGLAIADLLKIKLTEVPRSTWSTFKSQGLLPALYMIFRNRVYDIGYWNMRLKVITGRYKFNSKPMKVS